MTLAARFKLVPRPSQPGAFALEEEALSPRVARSFDNNPAMLFSFTSEALGGAARKLANISYRPPMDVQIVGPNGDQRVERLAVLECRATERHLTDYFFRVVESVLFDGGILVNEARFEAAFDALIRLFSALQGPAKSTVQGLWVELAIIAWSASPSDAISAWHSSSRALHDFSAGHFRLEVKSTSRALREHSFLLDQLTVVPGGQTLIASVMVAETSDGASVYDLLALIATRAGVKHEQAQRLETIVAETLGASWQDAVALGFDLHAALESLAIFQADHVPSVPQPLPAQVKDVRFVADLSGAPSISLSDARMRAAFFAQLLPADG